METFFIALAVIVLGGACVWHHVGRFTLYEINIPLGSSPNMPPLTKIT